VIDPHFEPRQRAGRRRSVAYDVLGGAIWLVGLAVTAFLAFDSDAIAVGLAIAAVSFGVAALLLCIAAYLRRRDIPLRPKRRPPETAPS
jgi:hypothetical protein